VSRYRIRHVTRYEYEAPVVHAHHVAYLRPRALPDQHPEHNVIHVEPISNVVVTLTDYFGNRCDEIEVLSVHDMLEVTAESELEITRPELDPDLLPEGSWEAVIEQLQEDAGLLDIRQFCFDSPLVRISTQLASYAAPSFSAGRPLAQSALDLCHRLHSDFTYDPTVTDVSTPLARVLRYRRGVCQDFAHVAIGCLRSLGLAARYVSGYMETTPPPGKPRLVGADASHAWASCYVPGYGWLDFDPTNDLLPGGRHITLAYGRDFGDASPLRGVVHGGGSQRLSVSVDVQAIDAE
jgi:transglutaminase-like putative cysteine protease